MLKKYKYDIRLYRVILDRKTKKCTIINDGSLSRVLLESRCRIYYYIPIPSNSKNLVTAYSFLFYLLKINKYTIYNLYN